MVDFKSRLKNMGKDVQRASECDETIRGIRTSWVTGIEREVVLQFRIDQGPYGPGFQLLGGPTGYESFTLTAEAMQRLARHGWLACMGTKRSWDRLFIPASEMQRAFSQVQPMLAAAGLA